VINDYFKTHGTPITQEQKMSSGKRILIVGGVAGGASAAARARRLSEDAEIVIFERGQHISFANCGMPYHIGGAIEERSRLLVQTPQSLKARFRIDVRLGAEVVSVDRKQRTISVRDTASGKETTERYDALILSPGAEPVRPPIPGADLKRVYTLRSMTDMDAIKKAVDDLPADTGRAIIIGGGYIGLEMAEAIRARSRDATLVELSNQVFMPFDAEMAAPLHQHLLAKGVDLRLKSSVESIAAEGDTLRVRLSNGNILSAGLVILAVGVRPEVKLAREAGLEIGATGGILVDEHMRTTDESVYAVGDAVEVEDYVSHSKTLIPLAGPANRQGRIVADNIFGRPTTYQRTQGTAVCKVFDLTAGTTGLNEKTLKRLGKPYEKIYVHPADHATYYPGATQMSLKLLFNPADGKIYGAQAVGTDGIDKRIDVLAVAIRAGMTVMDLQDLELSYAPPYGSAKDPVNYAGFVAANALQGDVKLWHSDELPLQPDKVLLDVRTPAEVKVGTIPGAVNISVDDLRERLGELPKNKELFVFCQVGLRGYVACRILTQKGFNCRNLPGGYKTYQAAMQTSAKPVAAS
jgi:NADPH-dependent 2,4-dienoyl-CoA reductase/sulfur reductase-like enzyme/rhodanese-related sulfurtransferase